MNNRRPLIAGLNTPHELDDSVVRAFVKQDPVISEAPRSEPIELSAIVPVQDSQKRSDSSEGKRPPRRKARNNVVPIGLIPVTVRLRPEIAGALKRASLERQLLGEAIFTQQDLVEQVLEPWLKQEGYMG